LSRSVDHIHVCDVYLICGEFPVPTDISYGVYGVRLFILYLFTFCVVMLRIKELSFFSSIQKFARLYFPRFLGSSQDISALLEVMSVTMRFVGLSGRFCLVKVQKMIVKCKMDEKQMI
jgi:hypothetical protein